MNKTEEYIEQNLLKKDSLSPQELQQLLRQHHDIFKKSNSFNLTRKRNHPEHQLQVYLCQELDKMVALNKCFYFAVPNGGVRGGNKKQCERNGKYLQNEGVRAGVSDLVVLLPEGITIFVEMKAEKGKQSASQKQFQKQVEALGFTYIILNSERAINDFVYAICDGESDIDKIIKYCKSKCSLN